MITIKISKRIKVQKYKGNGLRIYINLKSIKKWISIKLTEREVQFLLYIIRLKKEYQ